MKVGIGFLAAMAWVLPWALHAEDGRSKDEQKKLDHDLLLAAGSDVAKVRQLLQEGANPNAVDELYANLTPLTGAVEHAQVEITRMLLEAGAKPNVIDAQGRAALHEAANYPAKDDAAETKCEAIIRLLLDAKADVNLADNGGGMPLFNAARHPVGRTRLLLDAGAKVDLFTIKSAAEGNNLAVLDELIKRGAKAVGTLDGQRTVLHANAATRWSRPPFDREERFAILDRLLALQVPVDARDEDGCTALHLAAFGGDENLLRWLLEHHADPNLRDRENHSAFWFASFAEAHAVPMAMLLREHGAHLPDGSADGGDFCEMLIANDNVEALAAVFDQGWKPRSAMHILLVLSRENVDRPLPSGLLSGMISRLAPMIEEQPNEKDGEGNSLLIWAVRAGEDEAVRLLLKQRRIKVDQRDAEGRTALMWAAASSHPAIQKLLLKAGANASLKDQGGRSATDYEKLVTIPADEASHESKVKASSPPEEESSQKPSR